MLRRFYSLSLRTHLLLITSLLALPAIALIIHSGISQHADSLKKGFAEARRLTNSIAREQQNLSSNIEQLLTALGQIPEIERHDATATNSILGAILKKNPQFANIIVTGRSGDVWASALPMTAPFSIKERRSFQQAVKTRRFSTGDFGIGAISRKPTIGFGYPVITAGGDLVGVISANINFDHLNELLHTTGFPTASSFTIIDCNGVIVYRNLDPEKHIGTRFSEELFRSMENGPERATFIDLDETGAKKIISYRKLKLQDEHSPYLYIRASFPLEKVMERARNAMILNLAVLLPLLMIAVLAAIFLGNLFFVKRIERLQQAAERLAEGDFQTRISDAVPGGEIGRLGEAFDEMARKLSARQEALVRSERELYELNQNLAKRVEEETERRVSQVRLLARHARLVAMGEMIGAIAHQWRQPLATLGAVIQSIRMAWERSCLNESFLERAEADAQKQLYYMSDTIEDFRNFFRPEKIAEKFDIREKIDEVVLLVSSQFSNSGVRLNVIDNSPDCRLSMKGYQNEFKQSLLNIVSNAFDTIIDKVQRNNQHGDTHEFNGKVTISISCERDKAIIEVQDNGCGIPNEYADKVFDPYFTTKSGEQGTGIGLYMTKLITEESMGGRLSFESGPAGTRFRIELTRDNSCDEADNG